MNTLERFVQEGSSPGGPCPLRFPAPRRKYFSRLVEENSPVESFAVLNELGLPGGMIKLSKHQGPPTYTLTTAYLSSKGFLQRLRADV